MPQKWIKRQSTNKRRHVEAVIFATMTSHRVHKVYQYCQLKYFLKSTKILNFEINFIFQLYINNLRRYIFSGNWFTLIRWCFFWLKLLMSIWGKRHNFLLSELLCVIHHSSVILENSFTTCQYYNLPYITNRVICFWINN